MSFRFWNILLENFVLFSRRIEAYVQHHFQKDQGRKRHGSLAQQAEFLEVRALLTNSTTTVLADDSGGPYTGKPYPANETLIVTNTNGSTINGNTTFAYYPGSSVGSSSSTTPPTDVGTYTVVITFTSLDPGYKSASSAPVTFSITPVAPSVVASDAGGPYNGNPFSAGASVTGVDGGTVNGSTSFTYYSGSSVGTSGSSTAPTAAGTYTVVAAFTSADPDYIDAASSPVTFTISQIAPTVVATDAGGPFNSSPYTATSTATGLNGPVTGSTSFTYYSGSSVGSSGSSTAPTAAGTYTVVAAFTSFDPNYTNAASSPVTFTISQIAPTVVAIDAGGAYNGNPYAADATVTGLNGPVNGSTAFTYYSGSSVGASGSSTAPTAAGVYTVVAAFSSSNPNYTNASSLPVTFAITAISPTVVATDAGGSYKGSPYAATATATGLNGTVSGTSTFTYYSGSSVGTSGSSTAPTAMGTYTVVAAFTSSDPNYKNASSAPLTFSITAIAPTVIAIDAGGPYNGSPYAATGTATGLAGTVSGSISFTYYSGTGVGPGGSSTAPTAAGTYTVVASFTSSDPNYRNAASPPLTFTITAIAPTVVATDAGGPYNGSPYAATSTATGLNGPVTGSTTFTYYSGSSVGTSGSSTAPTAAGTYTVVASFTSSDSNYTGAASLPVTFAITAIAPTVVAIDAGGPYKGSPYAATSTATGLNGPVTGSTTFTYYSGSSVGTSGSSTAPTAAGTYTVVASFTSSDSNYTGAASLPVTFAITAIAPTVVAADAGGPYNGNPYAATDTATGLNGTVSGTSTFTYYTGSSVGTGSSSIAPTSTGTYTVVAAFTSSDPNYTNASSSPVTFSITAIAPTVVATDAGGPYNGSPYAATATATGVNGTVSGSLSFTYYSGSSVGTSGSSTAPTAAGTYTVVAAFTSSDPNYTNASSLPVTFTISQIAPSVVATDAGGPYKGSPYAATATATGLNGPVTGNITFTYYSGSSVGTSGSSTAPTAAGIYTVVASFTSSDPNYTNASSSPVTYTISAIAPNVIATDAGGPYNGGPYAATATATGLNGPVTGSTTFTYYSGSSVGTNGSSTAPTAAGTYTVVAAFTSSDPNYTNTSSSPVTFTITAIAPTVVASDAGGPYKGSPYVATAAATGLNGPVSGTSTFTYYTGSSVGTGGSSSAPAAAGTYTVVAAFTSSDPNYTNKSSSPVTFTITAIAPTVVATDAGGPYKGSPYAATATATSVSGTVSGSMSFTYYSGSSVGTSGSSIAPTVIGTYTVVAAFTSSDPNYTNAASLPVTFTITQIAPSVVVTDAGGPYNGSPYSATASVTGLNGTVSGSTTFTYYSGSSVGASGSSIAPSAAGTYTVVASFTSTDPIYTNSASLPVTFTISQIAPTIATTDVGGPYNGNPYAATVTVTGLSGPVTGSTTFTYYTGSSVGTGGSSSAPTSAGTYTVVASFSSSDPNYADTSGSPVTFAISAIVPTIVVADSGGIYSGNPFPATATTTGLGGVTVSGSTTFTYYTGSSVTSTGTSTAPTTIGTYTVVAAFTSSNQNYSNTTSAPLTFNITSTPSLLAFLSPLPATLIAGGSVSNSNGSIVVQVKDKFGTLVTADNSTAITLNVNGVAVSTLTDIGGVVSFSSVQLTKHGTNTITVTSSPALTTASAKIAVSIGAPDHLAYLTVPNASIIAGTTMAPVRVAVEDIYNNIVTTDQNPITASFTNLVGTAVGPTSGPTATTLNGITTFSGIAFDNTGRFSMDVRDATDFPGTSLVSPVITNVNPATAIQMVVLQGVPATGVAGTLTPQVKIEFQDQFGNIQTNDHSIVTLSVTSGGTFANGQTTISSHPVNGIVSFSPLFNQSGTYTLTATDTEASLLNGTLPIGTIQISPAAPYQLVLTSPLPSTMTAGNSTGPIVVQVEDRYGNIVTDDTSNLTLKVNSSTNSTMTDSNGIVTFDPVTFTKTGTNTILLTSSPAMRPISATISVLASVPDHLTFITEPPASILAGNALPQIQVAVEDVYNNIITSNTNSISLSANNNGLAINPTVAAVNGVATFNNLIFSSAGQFTLTATDSVDFPTSGFTSTVVTATLPTKLAIVSSLPASLSAGGSTGPIQVQVEDKLGNLAIGDNSTSISLSVNGVVVSTLTDSNGAVTFNGVTLTKAGYNVIKVTSTPVLQAASSTIKVTAAAPDHLAYLSVPYSSIMAGITMAPVRVAVEDVYNNIVTTDQNPLTANFTNLAGKNIGPTSGPTASTVNGVTTFSGIVFDFTGRYSMSVSDSSDVGVTNLTSPTVTTVNPAPTTQLVVLNGLPTSGTAGVATSQVQFALEDQFGNLQTNDHSTVTLTVTSGGHFANGQSTITAHPVNGIASVSLLFNQTGTYALSATDSALPLMNLNLGSIQINSAAASQLVFLPGFSNSATQGIAVSNSNGSIVVQVEDKYGNLVNVPTTVSLKINGVTVGSATSQNGLATFTSQVLYTLGSNTISAVSGSLSKATVTITVS